MPDERGRPDLMSLGRPATGLPRYYMDCGWYRNKKFAGLPVESLFLFEALIGYSTEHASDGRAPADVEDLAASLGVRLSIVKKGLQPLVDRGRLRVYDGELAIEGYEPGTLGYHQPGHIDRERARINDRIRRSVFDRDGAKCRSCGSTSDLCVDHVRALAVWGTSDMENLAVLCRPCNSSKGVKPWDAWVRSRN